MYLIKVRVEKNRVEKKIIVTNIILKKKKNLVFVIMFARSTCERPPTDVIRPHFSLRVYIINIIMLHMVN